MVRHGLWLLLLSLLASCTQTPVPGGPNAGPTVPTTLSTDLNDGAHEIVADAQGNAYVFGYRNYDVDYRARKVEHSAEFFVSQLSANGTLEWLTVLPGTAFEDDLNVHTLDLDLAVTNAAVYALNKSSAQLHKLEFDGSLSWSRTILREGLYASRLFAAPNGTLYVEHYSDNSLSTVKAFSGEGDELWSRELPNAAYHLLGVGGDNGLYFGEPGEFGAEGVRNLYLHKYDAAGSPLWTRDIAPSIPFKPWIKDFPELTFVTRGNTVYTVVNFVQESPENSDGFGVANTEIRRFADDGTEVWSALLHPASTGSPTFDYTVLPVGVTDAADFYMLVEEMEAEGPNPNPPETYVAYYKQRLIRFSGEGQRTTSAVQTQSGSSGFTVAALVPSQIDDARGRPHTIFYTVNTTGRDLLSCNNDFNPSEPCVHTDIQVSLYKNNAVLQWSLR